MLQGNFSEFDLECGLDEVGRGCLAGPVVAAAVILPKGYTHETLTDSKKLSHKQRLLLEDDIKKNAISWAIAEMSPQEIDRLNILKASIYAMHKAVEQLSVKPQYLLVDGNRFIQYKELPHSCMVKGDAKYLSIAAASILAKNYRDALMTELAKTFSGYDWENNVGYPTKKHREGIVKQGITEHHRRSFKLLPNQLEIFV